MAVNKSEIDPPLARNPVWKSFNDTPPSSVLIGSRGSNGAERGSQKGGMGAIEAVEAIRGLSGCYKSVAPAEYVLAVD